MCPLNSYLCTNSVLVDIEVVSSLATLRLTPHLTDCFCFCLKEPGEQDPYMDPHFLNGSQDGSGRGRGGHLGRGRGVPPGAGGPR